MDSEWIRRKAGVGEYEVTAHAEDERQDDQITVRDLEAVLVHGEILEDYPDDPRGPSALMLGFGEAGQPIHVVVGRTRGGNLRVITVYVPAAPKWTDARTRGGGR